MGDNEHKPGIEELEMIEPDRDADGPSGGFLTLAKGTVLSFVGEMGRILVTYVYGIIIARFAGVDIYGLFFLAITIQNLAGMFSYCMIEDSLMRFLAVHVQKGEIQHAKGIIGFSLKLSVALGCLMAVASFLLAGPIAEGVFRKPDLAPVLRHMSPGIPLFALMTISVASIRGFKNVMGYTVVRKLFLPLATLLLCLPVLLLGYGVRGLAAAYVLSLAGAAALGSFWLRSFLGPHRQELAVVPPLRDYFWFAGSALAITLSIFVFNWSDLMILGIYRPAQDLGVYMASKKTALMLSFLHISLNAIFVPLISHFHSANDREGLARTYRTASHWMLMFSLPIYLAVVFFSREILSLFGPVFAGGAKSLVVLATCHMANIAFGPNGYVVMMTGHQRWMAVSTVISAVASVALALVVVPAYGMLGAAWVNGAIVVLINMAGALVVYFLLDRLHPFNVRYLKIVGAGGIAALLTLVMRLLVPGAGSLPGLLAQLAVLSLTFAGAVLLLGLDHDERQMLLMVRRKVMGK